MGRQLEIAVEEGPIDPRRRRLEIVERKGPGHPDSLCDAAAEALSRRLSRCYLDRTGRILHHNVDKALLVAGETRARFGGGEWIAPIAFHLAGRVTADAGGQPVPLDALAGEAVREAIGAVRHLEPEHVVVRTAFHSGAADLQDLFAREEGGAERTPLANDTSFGVGFAPRSAVERLVLDIDERLGAPETRAGEPAIGEDRKVMAARHGSALRLTLATAMVAGLLPDEVAYERAAGAVAGLANECAAKAGFEEVEVAVNAADVPGRSRYLTLSGTSAECGDDGQVGRGNRTSGLITPMRPMTLEAFAGKNPTSHVGKLLSLTATRVAEACAELPGVAAAECFLVSEIGRPVDRPQAAGVRVDASREGLARVRERVGSLVDEALEGLPELWREIVGLARPA